VSTSWNVIQNIYIYDFGKVVSEDYEGGTFVLHRKMRKKKIDCYILALI